MSCERLWDRYVSEGIIRRRETLELNFLIISFRQITIRGIERDREIHRYPSDQTMNIEFTVSKSWLILINLTHICSELFAFRRFISAKTNFDVDDER
jgi:hypothetical protein